MGDVSLLRNPNAQVFENLAIKKEMQRLGLITADIAQK
jgi:ethanolamine utilization microcompartment shell protein EutL